MASSQEPVAEHATAEPPKDTLEAERGAWRASLRQLNFAAWREGLGPAPTGVDSSLKRNSAFIKRVKQGNVGDAREMLLKEVQSLNLGKYLDELVPSIPELLWKCTQFKDRCTAVDILSALHARFGGDEFTRPMLNAVAQELAPRPRSATSDTPAEQIQKEEAARVTRQRNLLRGATELALVRLTDPGFRSGTKTHGENEDPGWDWLFKLHRDLVRVH